MRDHVPAPRAIRVTGSLDTISASKPQVVLELKDGVRIPARMEEHDPTLLQQLFNARVVVSGVAHFAPSGEVRFIRIEWMGPAEERDEIFEKLPVARGKGPVAPIAPQKPCCGVLAFFGTWPGDESEEELLAALREIR